MTLLLQAKELDYKKKSFHQLNIKLPGSYLYWTIHRLANGQNSKYGKTLTLVCHHTQFIVLRGYNSTLVDLLAKKNT